MFARQTKILGELDHARLHIPDIPKQLPYIRVENAVYDADQETGCDK